MKVTWFRVQRLCILLCVGAFCLGISNPSKNDFHMNLPTDGTTRLTNSAVSGSGPVWNGSAGTFAFGTKNGAQWITENDVTVMASNGSWGGTIPAPSGGWVVGTSKWCWIQGPDGRYASSNNHIVQ